jgi:hypothetical protein
MDHLHVLDSAGLRALLQVQLVLDRDHADEDVVIVFQSQCLVALTVFQTQQIRDPLSGKEIPVQIVFQGLIGDLRLIELSHRIRLHFRPA